MKNENETKMKQNKPKMQLGGTLTLQFVKIDFLSIFFMDDFNRIENFLGYLKQHFFININFKFLATPCSVS